MCTAHTTMANDYNFIKLKFYFFNESCKCYTYGRSYNKIAPLVVRSKLPVIVNCSETWQYKASVNTKVNFQENKSVDKQQNSSNFNRN